MSEARFFEIVSITIQAMTEFFTDHFSIFLWLCGILGLCVGSILNIIMHQLPRKLEQNWYNECYLAIYSLSKDQVKSTNELINEHQKISFYCVHCQGKLPLWSCLSLLRYFRCASKCHNCYNIIALRYLGVELLTCAFSVIVAYCFGVSWVTGSYLLLLWSLILLTGIDFTHYILPDSITLSLLWVGLLINTAELFVPLTEAVVGAVLGYSSLWAVALLFRYVRGIEGIGRGDFKLLAVFGAWWGAEPLTIIVFFASLMAGLVGTIKLVLQKQALSTPLPFGPYLAFAGILVMFFSN